MIVLKRYSLIFVWMLFSVFCFSQKALIPEEKDGKWGFVNAENKELVVPFQYTKVEGYNDLGYALVWKDSLCGYLDGDGEVVLETKYLAIQYKRHSVYNKFDGVVHTNLNGKWGVRNKKI